MAIAPLLDIDGIDDGAGAGGPWPLDRVGERWAMVEAPWPRPVLRAVRDDPEQTECRRPPSAGRGAPAPRRGEEEAARRRLRRRARARARRRALLLAGVVAALVTALALPVRALGGAPATSPSAPRAAHLAGATVYVVQPGDTLWSIAERFDRGGDPRPMAEALARETGSATVVPGERIPIP